MKFQNFSYFLFLLPFFAGCQTSNNNDPLALHELIPPSKDQQPVFKTEQEMMQLAENDISSVNNSKISLENKESSDKNQEVIIASQNEKKSSRYSIIKFQDDDDAVDINGDEIVDSEDLASVDSAVLENAPENFQFDSAESDKMNPLLCNEGLFYGSWVAQFDKEWNEKYSKNYKHVADKNKALAQARTNEFIRLVYPAIEKTGYDFPVVINSQVLSWIGYFTGVGRKNFVVWLERGRTFIPEMQKTLEQNGLPSDLVYLSMIESGYSTKSLSNVGAVGLWQFMPATAREYGLKINDWLDERRDVVKSTQAASQYLSDLYARFGSWHLAAAGYNGGPGLVSKTLRNYGQDSSFFELTSKNRINSQTANYVPKILAAMIVAKNPSIFGFDSSESSTGNQVKTIAVTRSIALADLAEAIHVNKTVLENLNPQLRLGITPPPSATTEGKYNLLVPASKVDVALASLGKLPDAPTNRLVAARVKHLEKVSAFAKRYKVSMASLLKSNSHLKSNSSLRKGQVVYISVTLGSGQYDNLTTVKYNHHKHKKVVHSHKSHKGKHHSVAQSKKQKPTRVAFANK